MAKKTMVSAIRSIDTTIRSSIKDVVNQQTMDTTKRLQKDVANWNGKPLFQTRSTFLRDS